MASNYSDEIRNLNEKYEDAIFSLIISNVAQIEGKLLYEENEKLKTVPENIPSKKDIVRFTRLLDLKTITPPNKQPVKLLRKFAVTAAVIIILFSLLMVTVEAFRMKILNFIVKIEPKYALIQLNEDESVGKNDQLIINWNNAYAPTYIPEGYEVKSISCTSSAKKVIFSDTSDNLIIFTDFESTYSLAVDTENASNIDKIDVNGKDGTISIKDNTITIAWTIDSHLITIQSQLSSDELIRIAESVKYIN